MASFFCVEKGVFSEKTSKLMEIKTKKLKNNFSIKSKNNSHE